jgi:hypothetical protein
MRIVIAAKGDMTETFELGGADHPVITGQLRSAMGNGLGYHRVVALGRWHADAPVTEVSTVDYTGTDGEFQLVLAANLVGDVEIVANPYADLLAPTLHLAGVPATQPPPPLTLLQPVLGDLEMLEVRLSGVDGNGEVGPVRGARVRVTTNLGEASAGETSATFTAEGTTSEGGSAKLEILGGAFASRYRLEVVPQAGSNVGVVFDQPLTTSLQLPSRVAMTGVVTDADGNPVKDVAVTARPSLRFLWSLDDAPQAFISSIPAATTTTSEAGVYVLWVDPMILGTWGRYDLMFEPPASGSRPARAPAWVVPDVEIPTTVEVASVPMTQVQLPDAAYVRGTVTAPDGQTLTGAEVKVFRMADSFESPLCSQVRNAPVSCPIPASLLGRGTSNTEGVVRLALPH